METKGVAFCSVPGPLQPVQRAELWGAIQALQACTPVFVGVDNKNVANHVGNLLAGRWKDRPPPLVKGGDLLHYVSDILRLREGSTVRVCKVKGDSTKDMVARGMVRRADNAAQKKSLNKLAPSRSIRWKGSLTCGQATFRTVHIHECETVAVLRL